jgi:SAM-dependent methyltransferase
MQQVQELAHPVDTDYRTGSPHLKHQQLFATFVSQLREVLSDVVASGLPPTLLDIGAGDGAFVEPALAAGFRVTATEMSRPTIAKLQNRFGGNPSFTAYFVQDDEVYPIHDDRFSVILCASVLHHIPDYLNATDEVISHHLELGGTFLSFQDPLWYPSLHRSTRLFSEAAYLSWRLTQGNFRRGFQTRLRRWRGVYDDSNLSDTAEYHVVRSGLDHQNLIDFLSIRFESVHLFTYWSTQSGFWQRVGDRIGAKNSFAIHAREYRGTQE